MKTRKEKRASARCRSGLFVHNIHGVNRFSLSGNAGLFSVSFLSVVDTLSSLVLRWTQWRTELDFSPFLPTSSKSNALVNKPIFALFSLYVLYILESFTVTSNLMKEKLSPRMQRLQISRERERDDLAHERNVNATTQ